MLALILAVALAFGPSMEFLSQVLPDDPATQLVAHVLGCLIILGAYAPMVRLGEDRAPGELAPKAAPFGLLADWSLLDTSSTAGGRARLTRNLACLNL